MTTLDSTGVAAVDPSYFWQPMSTCPRSAKVQLRGKGGVAVYGQYHGERDCFWTGWAPLPKSGPPKPLVHNIEAAVDAWVEMERKAWMFDELVRFSKQPGVDAETLAQALLDLHVNIVHPAQTHSTC